jgi:hypothetical protein
MGTMREHIAYIGREFMIEFSRVSLPVYVISEEVPESFLSNLDTRGIG